MTMSPEVRHALNMAARVVETEAILFYEEAAEMMPDEDETSSNERQWVRHALIKGRALSLRVLANTIRSLRL